jgi:hypothetical protein
MTVELAPPDKFDFMTQMLLDGQTFFHAVFGIICGIAAVIGGLVSARKDFADEGRRSGWDGLSAIVKRAMAREYSRHNPLRIASFISIWCVFRKARTFSACIRSRKSTE